MKVFWLISEQRVNSSGTFLSNRNQIGHFPPLLCNIRVIVPFQLSRDSRTVLTGQICILRYATIQVACLPPLPHCRMYQASVLRFPMNLIWQNYRRLDIVVDPLLHGNHNQYLAQPLVSSKRAMLDLPPFQESNNGFQIYPST